LCVWRDVALAHQTLQKPAEHIEAEKGVGGSCVDEQALAAVHCVLGGVRWRTAGGTTLLTRLRVSA
jgi:hypothetical protein